MLEYLRNAAEKPLAKILIAILAFSFVGWGVAEWIFGNVAGNNALVTVGGADVTVQQFNMEKSRELANMSRDQQRAVYADVNATREFNAKVLSTLASQQMAENRADDLGFVVSDARVAREIREFPEFQNNGQFSTFLFDTILANSGYSEAQFANVIRSQVLRNMVLGSMSVPLPVAQFQLAATYNARNAMRAIEYSTVKFSDFKAPTPTDDELRTFYAQHPHVIPEMRTVSYILIPADMSKPDAYDAAYATAQKVEDDIIAGESMSVAANRHKVKFTSLKPFDIANRPTDEVLTDTMVTKIFNMDEGTESELIETKKGFVLVRVDKVAPAHNAEFDAVKKTLGTDWARDWQRKQAYLRANEILVDLNADKQVKGRTATSVTRMSGAPNDVLVAAFANNIGTSIVPGADAFYVLTIKSETMPKADAKKMSALRGEAQNMSTRAIMDDYNSFLMREYPTKVNEKLYNRFFAE